MSREVVHSGVRMFCGVFDGLAEHVATQKEKHVCAERLLLCNYAVLAFTCLSLAHKLLVPPDEDPNATVFGWHSWLEAFRRKAATMTTELPPYSPTGPKSPIISP